MLIFIIRYRSLLHDFVLDSFLFRGSEWSEYVGWNVRTCSWVTNRNTSGFLLKARRGECLTWGMSRTQNETVMELSLKPILWVG